MISKAKVKFIKSLQLKKYRKEAQCFTVEGAKGVQELLNSDFEAVWMAGTPDFLTKIEPLLRGRQIEVVETSEKELSGAGIFQSNNSTIAIVRLRVNQAPVLKNEFVLVLPPLDVWRSRVCRASLALVADHGGGRSVVSSVRPAAGRAAFQTGEGEQPARAVVTLARGGFERSHRPATERAFLKFTFSFNA